MKIVYLINTLGTGGAEAHLLNLVRDMMRRGYKVWVVILRKKVLGGAFNLEQEFDKTGANLIYLRSFFLGDVGRWFHLASLLRQLNPDILHSHLPRADMAASMAKAMVGNFFWVSTIHDAHTKDSYSGYWIFPYVKGNWTRGDYFIAVSNNAKTWGLQTLGLPASKTEVIYHGIQVSEALTPPRETSDGPLSIGCLARFEKRKGIETLVRAMAVVRKDFPEAKLLLAGSDPTGYSAVIKRLAKSLDLSKNVEIRDFCATPLDFLRRLDLFAFASISEGFGIVLIEAMSESCPIVASDIYPINHIVQHGETGILVNPDDPVAFALAIVDLLEHPEKRRAMGVAGHRRCIQEFSLGKSLDKTHETYLRLIHAAGPQPRA